MVPDLPMEEMERRKRLYEAAPALLALLERAVAIADGKTIDRAFETDCRAAIRAAKGES